VRNVFYAATKGRPPAFQLADFTRSVAQSTLSAAELVQAGAVFNTWDAILGLIANSSHWAAPSVVVIDELPFLIEQDRAFEGFLQTTWDRALQRAPVMLVVIGSDISMMTALAEYNRPLFGRPTKIVHLLPLSPADTSRMGSLEPTLALDAYLVTGGFPLLARAWGKAPDVRTFLSRELADPTSALIVSGERMLAAEFPPQAQARAVLSSIGAGERTFSAIGIASGVPRQSLERALDLLVNDKAVVDRILPSSTKPSNQTRYFISDPYMRFWLRFIEGGLEEIERGRGGRVTDRIMAAWSGYRGKAIEPLVREAIERLLPLEGLGDSLYVGAYWTRTGDIEVDLVGTDKQPPKKIGFIGSIKWRERSPFTASDLVKLEDARSRVPGAGLQVPLLGVSRSGFKTRALDRAFGPKDLLRAWTQRS